MPGIAIVTGMPWVTSERERLQPQEGKSRFEYTGPARLGKRTKRLVKNLRPGDIALIDHRDIDRVSGEELARRGVRCVVNVAPSSTGEYPNIGPRLLVEAGVHLVDAVGAPLFDELKDGDLLKVRGGELSVDGRVIARGEVQDHATVDRNYEEAKRQVGVALERFAENTLHHIRSESELLSGSLDLPAFETVFRDRQVLVVVRGVDHQKDLRALRTYIRDERPLLVGVDGGADALIDEGHTPHMIVGDMDSADDGVLACGAELVVHAYADGRAPGRDRLERLGLEYQTVAATGTSEDIAMLIAAEEGASLIVTVGSHFNLVEFLDKNRKGMASTFLTRVRIGEILVDAKGLGRLYRPRPGRKTILGVALAGAAALLVTVFTSPALSDLTNLLWLKLKITLGL
jgi:uncharacterized membrane-anchored protein